MLRAVPKKNLTSGQITGHYIKKVTENMYESKSL